MLLTSGTEIGTNQWIAALLANVSDNPILLLVWISGIMAVTRLSGGALIHNIKSTIVLLTSSVLSFIGCIMMGYSSGVMFFASAGIFALGIAFFWPSMLGFVSENIPASGALGLAIMGGIGHLGGAIAQPLMGAIFDAQTSLAVPAGQSVDILRSALAGTQEAAAWAAAQLSGGAHTLRYVATVPAVLIILFTFLSIWKKKHLYKT
jgi:fucose permease